MEKMLYVVVRTLMKLYVEFVASPWLEARFYAAWEEYRKGQVYRERLICMGFAFACETFLKDRGERKYWLKKRLENEPELKWRIWFAPFTIPVPDMLQTAANSGIFD